MPGFKNETVVWKSSEAERTRAKKNVFMKYAYLDWLTSIKDPILEVVNEMCSSPMTISSSYKAQIMMLSITNPLGDQSKDTNK